MERDLAPIVKVLDEINQNPDSSLPSAGKISKNVSRRQSLFRMFLSFFCCSATPECSSMSRCSIRIVGSESPPPPSNGSSPTREVGLIRAISLRDELFVSSLGSESGQGEDSTPRSYVTADESSFGERVSEQDGKSSQSPASEVSDSIQGEDSTQQSYVLSDESSFGETVSEQNRRSISSPDSEGSGSIHSEDSTSQGYVTSEELTLFEITSEHDRRSIPSPASEGSDSIQFEYSSQGYVTSEELTQGISPQRVSYLRSIESTFPPQSSASPTIGASSVVTMFSLTHENLSNKER